MFSLNTQHTMLEVAKSIGADGEVLAIVDTISEKNPLGEEGYWAEASDFNYHHLQQVLSEPAGTDSRANRGVGWENAVTKPVTEPLQGLEVYSPIDNRILYKQRDPEGYRSARGILTVKGMRKTLHDRVIYGDNAKIPDQVNGWWTRYPNLTLGGVALPNLHDNGGRLGMAQSSTWAAKWGLDGVFFVYPRGGQDWISHVAMDNQLIDDDQGLVPARKYRAAVDCFAVNFGVCVADSRCLQRLANIDTANPWDSQAQIEALSSFPDDSYDDTVLYVPRRVWVQMNQSAATKSNVMLSWGEAWGGPVIMCFTVPVRMVERLSNVEAVAS